MNQRLPSGKKSRGAVAAIPAYQHEEAFREMLERLSIGALLCSTKETEVVRYALARSVSPALIAEYETELPDTALLKRKLHKFRLAVSPSGKPAKSRKRP